VRSAPDDGIVKQRKGEFLIRSILAYNQEQILRWPQLGAKSGNFAQKALQRLVDIAKATFMGNRLRHLHREAEVFGDIIGPALIGR
jgi:hypothetical protein